MVARRWKRDGEIARVQSAADWFHAFILLLVEEAAEKGGSERLVPGDFHLSANLKSRVKPMKCWPWPGPPGQGAEQLAQTWVVHAKNENKTHKVVVIAEVHRKSDTSLRQSAAFLRQSEASLRKSEASFRNHRQQPKGLTSKEGERTRRRWGIPEEFSWD